MKDDEKKVMQRYAEMLPDIVGYLLQKIVTKCSRCFREDVCICTAHQRNYFCLGPYRDKDHWKLVVDYKTKMKYEELPF